MTYEARFDENRKFGVEVEVYGVTLDRIAKALARRKIYGWKLVGDDSIVGEHSIELVSPVFVGGLGLAQVGRMMYILNDLGCQVNDSCGFHVHHCVEDYTGKNMLSLLRFYSKFEPVIDYLVAPSRRGKSNIHCQSMVKGPDLQWVDDLDPTGKKRALDIAVQFGVQHPEYQTDNVGDRHRRQHKLNAFAYLKQGTVEFRQHQGTVDYLEAMDWVQLTQMMVSKSKQTVVSNRMGKNLGIGALLRSLKLLQRQRLDRPDEFMDNFESRLRKRYAKNMGW